MPREAFLVDHCPEQADPAGYGTDASAEQSVPTLPARGRPAVEVKNL
jgi:hypothetical protein